MNIALIGWYGHGNAGDDRISFCMNKFLLEQGHKCHSHCFLKFLNLSKEEINQYDYIIMGGGGLINLRLNFLAKKLEKTHTRFSCMGVSIDAVAKSNKQFIKALLKKSEICFDSESLNLPYHIGMRLHHFLFCVQKGIPCVSLGYMSKNFNTINHVGLSKLAVDIFNVKKELLEAINYMKNNYGEIRREFLEYKNKAHKELWETMEKNMDVITAPL